LIEEETQLGDVTLQPGQILLALKADDAAVGDAPTIAVTKFDIFVLDVTATGDGTSVATATLLFEGADVGLDNGGKEDIWGVSLYVSNHAPEASNLVFNLDENSANGMIVGSASASDADAGDTLHYAITAGNTGGAFAIDANTGQITVADSTLLDYETTPVFTLTVAAIDPEGAYDTATITVTVTNVAPTTLTITGTGSVAEGGLYTLNLSADEDVTSWTINWGDGTTDPIDPASSPLSGSHVYADNGIYTVTVTATDDDGDSGSDTLTVTTSDLGATGTGGIKTDVDTVDTCTNLVCSNTVPPAPPNDDSANAIVVGAGDNSSHVPECWTDYGSRIDVERNRRDILVTGDPAEQARIRAEVPDGTGF